jgi:hypothetical protein
VLTDEVYELPLIHSTTLQQQPARRGQGTSSGMVLETLLCTSNARNGTAKKRQRLAGTNTLTRQGFGAGL